MRNHRSGISLVLLIGAVTLGCAGPLIAGELDPLDATVLPADELGPTGGFICCPVVPTIVPATVQTITVRTFNGDPIAGATVVVLLGANHQSCPGWNLTGTTDKDGVCTITLGAGGCSHLMQGSGVIKVNGVTIRSYRHVKGPDFDGSVGNRSVNLSDLVEFADQFNGESDATCHDYDNDQDCDIADLVIMGAAFSVASHCP